MKPYRPLDHLLAEHLGWPKACTPLLRLGLKCTGWWALYQKLEQSLHEGGPWAEGFPTLLFMWRAWRSFLQKVAIRWLLTIPWVF